MKSLVCALLALVASAPAWAASPFAGAWRGSWTDVTSQQSGSASLTIDEFGTVSGTVANRTLTVVGPLSGYAGPGGRTHLSYSYDGGRSHYSADGTMSRSSNRLVGRLTITAPNGQYLGVDVFQLTGTASSPFGAPNGSQPRAPGVSPSQKSLDTDESLPSVKQQQ